MVRSRSGYQDLRDFVALVEGLGELRKIRGTDPELEMGAIAEVASRLPNPPALLFDEIGGYKRGFRVLSNFLITPSRESLVFGVSSSRDPSEAVRRLKDRLATYEPVPPIEEHAGPVCEHILKDGEVDLRAFPFVKWHEQDGGRYACATATVLRDPESGYINVGSYRWMLVDRNSVVTNIGPTHHGNLIRRRFWQDGKSCPVAICLGEDPSVFVAAGTSLAWKQSEYEYAGWLKGQPVRVIEAPFSKLPVPADAEVVLDGEMLPPGKGTALEGPFGEASGYYAGGARQEPIVKIHAVLYRSDPIVLAQPPIHGTSRGPLSSRAAPIWRELENAGIPNIQSVFHYYGVTIVSIKQAYPGHPMQVGHAVLAGTGGYHGRFVIVVEEDVDPYSLDQVIWALATRCDPAESIDIARRIVSYRLDPRLTPEKRTASDFTCSAAIIDACRPFHWLKDYPKTTRIKKEAAEQTFQKWQQILLPE